LAFGCNDTQPIDEVNGEALDTQNQRANGEPLQDHRTAAAKRAGQLVKTQRLLEMLTQPDIVNPFADSYRSSQALTQCDVSVAPNIQITDSTCPGFSEYAHIVQVENCDFGNGDLLDATLYVSHPYIDDLETTLNPILDPGYMALVKNNREWSVDIAITTEEGSEIDSCGSVYNGMFRQTSDFTVDMPGALEGTDAQYQIQSTRQTRSLTAKVSRSEIHLVSSADPVSEVLSMNVTGVSQGDSGLLPDKGTARVNDFRSDRIFFRPNLSAEGSVYLGSFFHHHSVLDIPTL
jgi:hypothetical protein